MTDAPVRYDVADGVATVTFDRPDAMNSLDLATKQALLEAVTEAAGDDDVRCVLLTGTGRAFCVGQDLKEHVETLRTTEAELFDTVEVHYNPTVLALATMDKPVVAAVNGVAAGAGASLAFACDLRIMAEPAGFNLAFTGIALSCDTGSSWMLQRIVGRAKALELLYFPRTLTSAEALELGLATEVVPAESLAERAGEVARRLAAGPTQAYAAVRQAVLNSGSASFRDALEFEATMMTRTGATADHWAAVDAFLAKEKPVFQGR